MRGGGARGNCGFLNEMIATVDLDANTPMREVLKAYPGAQRALFARYHIGGCQSCGFQPGETLGEVCARNENIPVEEAVAHIEESHEADATLQISPEEAARLLETNAEAKLLDVRTREEFEAVHIPGAVLLTQEVLQEVFGKWAKGTPIVICDHTGDRALDSAAYLIGHGYTETRCLTGGIDAYAREVDATLPRYRVEME